MYPFIWDLVGASFTLEIMHTSKKKWIHCLYLFVVQSPKAMQTYVLHQLETIQAKQTLGKWLDTSNGVIDWQKVLDWQPKHSNKPCPCHTVVLDHIVSLLNPKFIFLSFFHTFDMLRLPYPTMMYSPLPKGMSLGLQRSGHLANQ